jgi:flagellar hook-associated protein 2
MSSTSSIFSGTSRYSSDFQDIIGRSVSIASLQLSLMQTQLRTVQSESSALLSIDSKFESLLSAVSGLSSAAVSQSSSVSNGSILSATVSSEAIYGTYTVKVIDPGSYGLTGSKDGLAIVTEPSSSSLSTSSKFTLTVGSEQFTIEPASNTLSALVDAINRAGAGVEATLVNMGSNESPDYRLSMRNTALGGVGVMLNDGGTELLDATSLGTVAQYQLNGNTTKTIESSSRTVTISPGLSVTLLKEGECTVGVARSTSAVSTAISSFVSAYNAAVDALDAQRGKDAGALKGNPILNTLQQALRELTSYSAGSGEAVSSLAQLGIDLDSSGKMSFNVSTFNDAASAGTANLSAFLGATTSDGFLKSAYDILNGLQDESNGAITSTLNGLEDETSAQQTRIDAEQERIDLLEQNLIERMASADAAIASLEQQVKYMTSLFDSMRSSSDNQ